MKNQISIYAVKTENGKFTDAATAFIDKQLRKMCYQSLKTNFAHSGNTYLLYIMNTALQSSIHANNADYKEIIENEYNGVRLMKVVTHTSKIVSGVRIPVKPYDTVELTDAGREYLKDTKENDYTESTIVFDDLLQSAWIAVSELNAAGLVTNFDSVWNMKHIIYRAINRAYYNDNKHNKYSVFSLDAENAIPQADAAQAQFLEEVETSELLELVKRAVLAKMDKRTRDKELAWNAWKICKIQGYTQAETGAMLGIHREQVKRYKAQVENIVQSVYSKFA